MSGKNSCLTLALACATMTGLSYGSDEKYPMPEAYSQSLIMGKTLRNPFAAKLRISQSRMEDLVTGTPTKMESGISERFNLRTTMYFGDRSEHNRAIINGRVRRPGDVLIVPGGDEVTATVDEIRPNEVTLVHRDRESGRIASLTLKTATPNRPSLGE